MLRYGEVILALAPFAAAALLWAIIYRRLPSRRAVMGIVAGVAVLGVALAWQGIYGTLTPHERYVPAHMQDGQLVEGHGDQRPATR